MSIHKKNDTHYRKELRPCLNTGDYFTSFRSFLTGSAGSINSTKPVSSRNNIRLKHIYLFFFFQFVVFISRSQTTLYVGTGGSEYSTIALAYAACTSAGTSYISYYRLKQTDYDGHCTFSEIRTLSYKKESKLFIFPNPIQTIAEIHFYASALNTVLLQVYNDYGSLVFKTELKSNEIGWNNYSLDFSSLSRGIYFIELIQSDGLTKAVELKE